MSDASKRYMQQSFQSLSQAQRFVAAVIRLGVGVHASIALFQPQQKDEYLVWSSHLSQVESDALREMLDDGLSPARITAARLNDWMEKYPPSNHEPVWKCERCGKPLPCNADRAPAAP